MQKWWTIYQNMTYTIHPAPTGTTESVWLPLSSITNYQAFNAIAWGTGYTPAYTDLWVSEVPYVVSDNMGWSDGITDETGWFATHRWNNEQYSLTFDHINYGWDNPDIRYGVSVKDNYRSYLGETTIEVCGQTEYVYMTEFRDWTYWKPCFGAFSDATTAYAGKVYVRVQPSDEIWYTTTDGQPCRLVIEPTATTLTNTYGVNGGVIKYPGHNPVDGIMYYSSKANVHDSNIKTIMFPVGSTHIGPVGFVATGITHVEIPPTVTELKGNDYFYLTPNFDGELPESVTAITANKMSQMWYYTSGLKHLNIRAQILGYGALSDNNLSSITFSSAITSVGTPVAEYSLSNNPDLISIRIEASTFPTGFQYAGNSSTPVNGTFYLPYGCDLTNFPASGRFST